MSIQSENIKWYKSALISDINSSSNGGRMSNIESVTNVKGNAFPDVPQAERAAGSIKMRKFFLKIESDPSVEMVNNNIFIDNPSPGDDYVLLQSTGSYTDTQNSIDGGTRHYGIGALKTSVSNGATQIVVTMENVGMSASNLQPFHPGDKLWISNQATISDTGQSEYVTVGGSSGDVSYSGADVTINIPAGVTYDWTASNVTPIKVASVIAVDSIKANYASFTITSAGGTFTQTGNVVLNGHATIDQAWTVTFTSASAFTLSGDTLGSGITTGTTGGDLAPNNAAFSKPYFTLKAAGWGGTYSTGNTITFTTHPAAVPYWEKRIVPAGASSIANTGSRVAISGESA